MIVEGPSDELILERATEKLYPEQEKICDFVAAGGAEKVAAYLSAVMRLSLNARSKIIGLLDQDQAGRKAMDQFRGRKQAPGTEFRDLNHTAGVYIGLLVVPDELRPLSPIFKRFSTSKEAYIPMPIEFCFPEDIIREALELNILRLTDRYTEARDGELVLRVNLTENLKGKLPDGKLHFAMKVDQSSKMEFAEWVCQNPRMHFAICSLRLKSCIGWRGQELGTAPAAERARCDAAVNQLAATAAD